VGNDTASFAGTTGGVIADLSTGSAEGGGSGVDTLIGIENLVGGASSDTLTGDAGSNLLDGGAGGTDTLTGGAGNDTYVVDDEFLDQVIEAAGGGVDLVRSLDDVFDLDANVENLELLGISRLAGSGNELNNLITGNSGANLLDGEEGDDTLIGGAGDDRLAGGNPGVDFGFDTASYAAAAGPVTASLGTFSSTFRQIAGSATATGAGTDTLVGIEALIGSAFADTLSGSEVANRLDGGAGNDVLNGADGADTLVGGAGADSLTGGAGADAFVFDSLVGTDTITGFSSGSDTLRIRQAGLSVGNGDTLVDGAVTLAGPGGFAAAAELVVITADIAGAITAASAAAAIGAASGAYAAADQRLFAVDNGTDRAVFLFRSSGADAVVSAAELTQLVTLSGGTTPTIFDYVFVT
jgi:Ca2+-binding RTX toxin-like protein